ncbi:MAG TPA: hypothetical protein VGK45_12765 [Thermoanaerobaculia bacterium]
MDSKPLKALVIIVGVLVGLLGVRYVVSRFRQDPEVPAEVLSKPWSVQSISGGELRFEAPWLLNPSPVDLPPEIGKNVESSAALSLEKDGLNVMAIRIKMRQGLALSLSGAADGTTANLRTAPGTLSVDSSKQATTVSNLPAYNVSATIHQQSGKSMALRGVVMIRGQSIYQVLVIYRLDQTRGEEVWKRMRDSVGLRF